MKTPIRRIIEIEMAIGPASTFAERLERELISLIREECALERQYPGGYARTLEARLTNLEPTWEAS